MGIIITDELIDLYSIEYRKKVEAGEIKNMNFNDYMGLMVHSINIQLGLTDEYFKQLESRTK